MLGRAPKWGEGSSLSLPALLPEAQLTKESKWTGTIGLSLSLMLSFCYVHSKNSLEGMRIFWLTLRFVPPANISCFSVMPDTEIEAGVMLNKPVFALSEILVNLGENIK